MRSFNKIILEGAVGSHILELGDDGLWIGQFDLHAEMDGTVMVLDCRVTEDGKDVKDLGAGIGGHDVHVEGIMKLHNAGVLEGMPYVDVTKLEIL